MILFIILNTIDQSAGAEEYTDYTSKLNCFTKLNSLN